MRILIALAAAAGLAGAAAAANAPQTSWGKANVSFDDYRSDATACLRVAAGTDLTGTEPANALVLASRRMAAGQTNDYTPSIGGASATSSPATGGFDPVFEAANRMQRERTVCNSMSGRAVIKMNTDVDGGSSSVFSSAFCAAGTSASASSTITTRRLPSNGR